jgi:hypothetical protein
MDNYVYNALSGYFQALEKVGYMSNKKQQSLLVLLFYYHLIYHDYRGFTSKKDYHLIEQALNCLYGTNCLIPYPDYLKMGKLKLGEMTEVLSRVKATEDYSKELDKRILDNDVLIEDNIRRLDEHGNRILTIENAKVVKGKNHIQNVPDIDLSGWDEIDDDIPQPSEVIVATYELQHIQESHEGVDIDDDVFIVPFERIISIYENYGNCYIRDSKNNSVEFDCYYYNWRDGDTANIEPEENFGLSGKINTPYKVTEYDYDTLTHPYCDNPALILVFNNRKPNSLYLTYRPQH